MPGPGSCIIVKNVPRSTNADVWDEWADEDEDDDFLSPEMRERLKALDAETARRLVDAIRTTPPPLSDADADDFGQRRARNAPRRACDAGWSLLEFARRGACDGASLLLEAGFVPAAVAAYHRAVSVALGGAADAPNRERH